MSTQQQQRQKEDVNNDTNAVPRTDIDIVGNYIYVDTVRIAKGSVDLSC